MGLRGGSGKDLDFLKRSEESIWTQFNSSTLRIKSVPMNNTIISFHCDIYFLNVCLNQNNLACDLLQSLFMCREYQFPRPPPPSDAFNGYPDSGHRLWVGSRSVSHVQHKLLLWTQLPGLKKPLKNNPENNNNLSWICWAIVEMTAVTFAAGKKARQILLPLGTS